MLTLFVKWKIARVALSVASTYATSVKQTSSRAMTKPHAGSTRLVRSSSATNVRPTEKSAILAWNYSGSTRTPTNALEAIAESTTVHGVLTMAPRSATNVSSATCCTRISVSARRVLPVSSLILSPLNAKTQFARLKVARTAP